MTHTTPTADGQATFREKGVGTRAPEGAAKSRVRVAGRRVAKIAATLVVAAVVAIAAHWALTRPTTVQTAVLEIGTVQRETRGPGTVQSRFPVAVGSRVTGILDHVYVDVGDEVKKGQLLATLDRTELEARSASAQRAVASAQQEVALAEANLEKVRSDVSLARANFARAEKLVGPGLMSVADFDQAKAALAAAEASERAARVAVGARKADLARLTQDQRVAETILSYATITSPMAGVVTRRALEPGATVAPGVTIFQVVDPSALWVATLVDESLTGHVEIGQHANIHLRSGANRAGHVVRITYEADPVTRELEIDVAFDERPARFAVNEEADVTIVGDEATGTTVPNEAVVHAPDGDAVFVVAAGRAHRRRVRLGVVGAKRAQVIEGLQIGETVVWSPKALRDEERVATQAAGG
jgi:RND family efflux transporter MFP subunit